jgi:homoserine acetyltransferase
MTGWTSKAQPGLHAVSDFQFADGRRLDVNLAYRTFGSLDADARNAVMLLHGRPALASSSQLRPHGLAGCT